MWIWFGCPKALKRDVQKSYKKQKYKKWKNLREKGLTR